MKFKLAALTTLKMKSEILAGKVEASAAASLQHSLVAAENNLMTSFRTVFIVCAALAAAVLAVSFFLKEIPLKDSTEDDKIETR